MPTDRARYMISVDDEMYEAIEDFRFTNRYNTRSDATQALIKLGLEAIKQDPEGAMKRLDAYAKEMTKPGRKRPRETSLNSRRRR